MTSRNQEDALTRVQRLIIEIRLKQHLSNSEEELKGYNLWKY